MARYFWKSWSATYCCCDWESYDKRCVNRDNWSLDV